MPDDRDPAQNELPDTFEDEFQTLPQKRLHNPVAYAAFRIAVVDGPDRGKRFIIDGSGPSRTLVGSSEACQLQLTDRTVSRRHMSLEVEGLRIRVCDLGSRNGTRVGGTAIVEAFIESEGVITAGSTTLRVERDAAGKAPALSLSTSFGPVLGESRAMRRLYPLCEKLAAAMIPVIIEGETGTGKEALAEALHLQGPRRNGPFVVFDCTAVPSNLVEAELFGHARGAFTGATTTRRGVFEEASGGTLLIDEIGDLDLSLQPKLLRAIDRNEVRPIGANKAIHVDLRIVAATRRNLDHEVQEGRFRDDLFHRLAVGRIELPPLRARRGDVTRLARHFWINLGGDPGGPPEDLLRRWEDHGWPGNVRELRNTVARHVALGELAAFDRHEAPAGGEPPDAASATAATMQVWLAELADLPLSEARQRLTDQFERLYVQGLLEKHGGNVTHAAKHAGVARRYLQILKARTGE